MTESRRPTSSYMSAKPHRLQIEFYQQDWIPGFAAYNPDVGGMDKDAKPFCVLNLGANLLLKELGHVKREELPYIMAEHMMHEIIHVLEHWAGVEFDDDKVEAVIEKYRAKYKNQPPIKAKRAAKKKKTSKRRKK